MDGHFKLVIGADTVSSTELAQILLRLDKSYKAFVRSTGGRSLKAELTVAAVRPGSIEVLVDAVDAAGKVYAARENLAPFASHLAQIVGSALGIRSMSADLEIAPVDRITLTSLAAPVANGRAQQVNIVNHGTIF
ncbi:hypothetical protein AAIH70_15830 [Neorhizobium sp. BT27B]|uniref:hypothetical protein n=1 Tax=Neorhizobium sp. BT27B TaxID=3142625 RepID=UPI003D281D14